MRRAIRLIRYDGPFPRIQDDMHRLGDVLDEGAVPKSADHRRALLDEMNPAVIDRKYAAIELDMPDAWKGKWSKDQWNDRALRNFDSAPRVVEVPEGKKLYRVVGNNGQADGSWWSFSKPPETEAAWRTRDAVRTDWNDGAAYIEIASPPPKHVLVGTAGPKEAASDSSLVHTGGGEQVFVPNFSYPGPTIPDLEQKIADTGGWYYTPWNDRAPKQAVVPRVQAGNPTECDL